MSKAGPRATVVIPAYNADLTLSRAIESVLAQTFSDFELTIVDDCSTDSTLAVAAEWRAKDSRISIVGCRRHHGMAYAFNKGVRKSTAPVIAKFDADDYSHPNRLAQQIQQLRKDPDLAAIGVNTVTVVGDRHTPYVLTLAETPAEIAVGLLFRAEILCGTMVYRRRILKLHPFPERIPVGAGRLHAHRLLKAGFKISNLSTSVPLVEYHRHDTNTLPRSEGPESDLMIRALLSDLSIEPTVEDLQTHRAASKSLLHGIGQHPVFHSHLRHNSGLAKQWFGRLEMANFQRKPHLYDTRILGRVIAEQQREIDDLMKLNSDRTMVVDRSTLRF